MKTLRKSIIIAAVLIAAAASFTMQGCKESCINGEGGVVTQSRNLGDFSMISFGTEGTVYVTQGASTSFTVEAQQNVIDDLITKVQGEELTIYNDHCLRDHAPIVIHITSPDVSELRMSGSGEIITQGKIFSNSLALVMSGSGSIETQDSLITGSLSSTLSGSGTIMALAKSSESSSVISGSGEIKLFGSSVNQSVTISGSGDFHGFDYVTDETSVNISGSGNAEIFANSILDVTISGSGNVYYKGFPVISTNISGSGNVINSN
jgi:hypothetical protein